MLFCAVYKTGVRFPSHPPLFVGPRGPKVLPEVSVSKPSAGAPGAVPGSRGGRRRREARGGEAQPLVLLPRPARARAPPRSERATEGGDPPFPPDPRGRCFFSRAAARHDTSVRTSSPSFLFLLVSRLLGHRCATSARCNRGEGVVLKVATSGRPASARGGLRDMVQDPTAAREA